MITKYVFNVYYLVLIFLQIILNINSDIIYVYQGFYLMLGANFEENIITYFGEEKRTFYFITSKSRTLFNNLVFEVKIIFLKVYSEIWLYFLQYMFKLWLLIVGFCIDCTGEFPVFEEVNSYGLVKIELFWPIHFEKYFLVNSICWRNKILMNI
jgi:hypothetical protein